MNMIFPAIVAAARDLLSVLGERDSLPCFRSGTTLGQSPLGQVQLTIRHSSQRNKLVVVVHACR